MTGGIVERFGKAHVCRLCAKATDKTCSGCQRPFCQGCFRSHLCASTFMADPTRARSPEADYGVWWREGRETYRVSYIRDTAEVYAVSMTDKDTFVIARVPADEGAIYYRTLDMILAGWEDECGKPDSLAWVRDTLSEYPA